MKFDDRRLELTPHETKGATTMLRFAVVWGVLWILGALVSLTLLGGAIYIVLHFIAKFW